MSKRSLFWGQGSGKLGEAVYYRSGGEQRTRTYVRNVKNPKTLAQMRQRIGMRNFVSMYRSLSMILATSFSTRKTNQSGFNAFMQANKGVPKYAIGAGDLQEGYYVPYSYLVSKGTISLDCSPRIGDDSSGEEMTSISPAFFGGVSDDAQVAWEANDDNSSSYLRMTGSRLYSALTSGGNPLSLPSDFKVTLLWGHYAGVVGDQEIWGLNAAQVVCNSTNADGFKWIKKVESNAELPQTLATHQMQGETEPAVGTLVDVSSIRFAIRGQYPTSLLAAVIVSWKDANGKLCTSSSVVGGSSTSFDYDYVSQFMEGGLVYEQVLEAYGYNQDSILNT